MEENLNKIEQLEKSIEKIDNKQNKIMFYLPSVPQASGGIGVVYSHAKRLHDLGNDVMIIYDAKDYIKPEWLGKEYCDLKHLDLNKAKLSVSRDDMVVYPEGFTEMMEKGTSLPCIKVILCQSYAYILPALTPSITWADFGISNVIVPQVPIKEYIESVFGKGLFDIQILPPAIDENIFKKSPKLKKPIIAVSARDQADLLTLSKHFYLAYPQYKMFSFRDMRGLTRSEFAEVLDVSAVGVWIDRIAGFGTFPIECAKTETPFIALVPDIIPEYAEENKGIWATSIVQLAEMVGSYIKLWLEDIEPIEIKEGLSELAKLYTKEDEDKNIEEIYNNFFVVRKNNYKKVIQELKDGK